MAKKKFDEQVKEFVEVVQESKEEQQKVQEGLSDQEEEQKRQEMIDEAWKDLPDVDKYIINSVLNLKKVAENLISVLTQKGKDFIALV